MHRIPFPAVGRWPYRARANLQPRLGVPALFQYPRRNHIWERMGNVCLEQDAEITGQDMYPAWWEG